MEAIAMTGSATRRLLFLGCLVLLATGCSTHEAPNTRLFKQWNAKCKEAADLLETIKDVSSAKTAEPKLKVVMQELHKLDERLQESYDSEDVDAVDAPRITKHVAEGIGQMQRLMVESLRIGQNPELRAALGETWKSLPAAAMMDAQGNLPATE